jgi:hypothetical protein
LLNVIFLNHTEKSQNNGGDDAKIDLIVYVARCQLPTLPLTKLFRNVNVNFIFEFNKKKIRNKFCFNLNKKVIIRVTKTNNLTEHLGMCLGIDLGV